MGRDWCGDCGVPAGGVVRSRCRAEISRRQSGAVQNAPADIVLHDLRAPSWIPLNDPATQLVFGGTGATVDTVIVDGKLIVAGGRIVAFDMEPILAEVRGLVQRQRSRAPDLQKWAARMEEIAP